jgi:large subunit ribosomal protein L23
VAIRKKAQEASKFGTATARDYAILRTPVITEKSSQVLGRKGATTVVFEVDKRATKEAIRDAVKRVFQVEVDRVNTCRSIGKVKRRGVIAGRQAASKKAYVTLKSGHTIDLVEGL